MKRIAWIVFALAALSPRANAQVIVEDPLNLIQNIQQVIAQAKDYLQQVEHYKQMLKDYENQIDQLEAMSGNRGMSFLANGAAEKLNMRRYMPSEWTELMHLRNTGGYVPPHVRKWTQNIDRVRQTYGVQNGFGAFGRHAVRRVPEDWARFYEDQRLTTEASMGQAMTTTGLTQDRLNVVEMLLDEMERGGDRNDLKRAVDLNTRVNGELAVLLAELNRTLAMQAYAKGAESQRALRNQVLYYRMGQVNE